jgi:SAM-dependent methyltransferase
VSDVAIWHDVECAAYDLDLPLWRELAEQVAGPLLDLGCGTGRVALDLARRGFDVTGLDADADLVAELAARARRRGLGLEAVAADARTFDLARRFALVIAPMQVVQLFGGPGGRARALERIRAHLQPGGIFAAALADPYEGIPDEDWVPPVPDIREENGWVYASTPISVRRRGEAAAIERQRQTVSPTGEISAWITSITLDLVTPAELEAEGEGAGFAARERGWIPESREWTGSTVVMLEAP